MVTVSTESRASLKDAGVIPVMPFDKRTCAFIGSEFTMSTSFVPRVILAQPDKKNRDVDASNIITDRFFINFVFFMINFDI